MVLLKKTEGKGEEKSWFYMTLNYAACCTASLLLNSTLCCNVAVESLAHVLKHAFFLLYHLFIRIHSSDASVIHIIYLQRKLHWQKNRLGA